MKKEPPTPKTNPNLGVIYKDAAYPLALFGQLCGLNTWALRVARRNGLKTKTVGIRKFITGQAWFDFLESLEH